MNRIEEGIIWLCEQSERRARETEVIRERSKDLARQAEEILLMGRQRRGRSAARRESVSPERKARTPRTPLPQPDTLSYEVGQRVVASVDLSVRGVKVVPCGTLGTIQGPSDDVNLPAGLNVLWDQRLDSSKRRINTAAEDIIPC
eukprot:TRINITY_DN1831_c1_g1_i1.p1 TRINITY_DN1831_c1_g1~~TRINITY_DN1831_c1_g1_i1.p1  ORF type:complete len:165 (+),score=20.81 TRINITY_DN1831_c1_g1_i1:62-496(+)